MPFFRPFKSLLSVWLLGGVATAALAQPRFVPRIAAGYSHSISLDPMGRVVTHGENRAGEIGDGTKTTRLNPVYLPPPSGQSWAQVAVGDFRSMALTTTGDLYSWGSNGYGQQGDGTLTDRLVPALTAAPAGSRWVGVAAGYGHTLALAANGDLYTWGTNDDGQLGIGTAGGFAVPRRRVVAPSGQPWTQVAAGYNFSLALCADGQLYAWGSNQDGQLGDGTLTNRPAPVAVAPPAGQTWTQLAGGFWSAAALCSDGSFYTWGNNFFGQLGTGTTTVQRSPVRIAPPAGQRWLQVAMGYAHLLAVCSDGALYAWGDNAYGQLGDGTNNDRLMPARVAPPAGQQWVQVAAGYFHSLALASDGRLYTAGYNFSGELGDGTQQSRNCFTRTCALLATRPVAPAAPQVFPNPFAETLTVLPGQPFAGSATAQLFNSAGQCVRREEYPAAGGALTLLQLARLPAGVYFLRLTTGQGIQQVKLTHQAAP